MAKDKKKAKPKSQTEQSERFKAAAVEAGVDMTGKEFERALDKMFAPRGEKTSSSRKKPQR